MLRGVFMDKQKKKKIVKLFLATVLFLIVGFAWTVYVNLEGYPWAEYLSRRGAQKYLDRQYPDRDFIVTGSRYEKPWFNPWRMIIFVESQSDPSLSFDMEMDSYTEVLHDNFALRQQEKIAEQMDREYDEIIRALLFAKEYPYKIESLDTDMNFGYTSYSDDPKGKTNTEDLLIDKKNDIEFFSEYRGEIRMDVVDHEINDESLIKLFYDTKNYLEKNNISFHTLKYKQQGLKRKDDPDRDIEILLINSEIYTKENLYTLVQRQLEEQIEAKE